MPSHVVSQTPSAPAPDPSKRELPHVPGGSDPFIHRIGLCLSKLLARGSLEVKYILSSKYFANFARLCFRDTLLGIQLSNPSSLVGALASSSSLFLRTCLSSSVSPSVAGSNREHCRRSCGGSFQSVLLRLACS
ncbi:hypothetical protein M758_5G152300 [Ceratodon purpureus]|nr:hypothetical protein M758_5G152300 [Ceratodon purpureus]